MRASRREFTRLMEDLLRNGHHVRFRAIGYSMQPEILHSDIVTIAPVVHPLADREVVLYLAYGGRPVLHRIIKSKIDPAGQHLYLLRGDARDTNDGWLGHEHILGRMVAVERRGQIKSPSPMVRLVRAVRRLRRYLSVREQG